MILPSIKDIELAQKRLKNVALQTPLVKSLNLSNEYESDVYLKREDLQVVRSFRIRGAYNKLSTITKEEAEKGIVCASAGNHAQGVALSCHLLNIKGKVYMPSTTTAQKVRSVEKFGDDNITIILTGDKYLYKINFIFYSDQRENIINIIR